MTASDIVQLAADNLSFLGPALLVFSGLAAADMMIDLVVRIVRRAGKDYGA